MNQIIETVLNNNELRKLDNYDLFRKKITTIKEDKLYQSNVHGLPHSVRTTIYALYLGDILELDTHLISILFDACIYHDIGRIDDSKDDEHGKRSADMIEKVLDYNSEDMKLIQAMLESHSNDDNKMQDIIKKYGVNDLENTLLLCKLLKDVDALDRFRLRKEDALDPKFLRLDVSKTLIKLGQMMCEQIG